MSAILRSAQEYSSLLLLDLFADIYASSSAMCESLEEKFPDQPSVTRYRGEILARPGGLFLIAETQTGPAGFISIMPRRPRKLAHTADLSMGISQGQRGQGIGRQLLQAAMGQITLPIEIIYLMVRADNAPAIGLYQSAGFTPLACLEDDTRVGTTYHDGLLMRARITHQTD